MTFELILTLF